MIDSKTHRNVFETTGALGVAAEKVAKQAVKQVKTFIHANAAVEEHLADQLLLPMAIAGAGCFTTTKPSLHTTTNIDVIKQLLGRNILTTQLTDTLWEISITS